MKQFAVVAAVAAAVTLASGPAFSPTEAAEQPPIYRHVLDGSPIDVPTEGEGLSQAVRTFHATGENPYLGDAAAIEDGKDIYQGTCAACHMPDGSGRIGPSFLDDQWHYDYTGTMRGRFAIVYGGGAGAMQAFNDRLTQDQILRVLAYLEKLRGKAE